MIFRQGGQGPCAGMVLVGEFVLLACLVLAGSSCSTKVVSSRTPVFSHDAQNSSVPAAQCFLSRPDTHPKVNYSFMPPRQTWERWFPRGKVNPLPDHLILMTLLFPSKKWKTFLPSATSSWLNMTTGGGTLSLWRRGLQWCRLLWLGPGHIPGRFPDRAPTHIRGTEQDGRGCAPWPNQAWRSGLFRGSGQGSCRRGRQ